MERNTKFPEVTSAQRVCSQINFIPCSVLRCIYISLCRNASFAHRCMQISMLLYFSYSFIPCYSLFYCYFTLHYIHINVLCYTYIQVLFIYSRLFHWRSIFFFIWHIRKYILLCFSDVWIGCWKLILCKNIFICKGCLLNLSFVVPRALFQELVFAICRVIFENGQDLLFLLKRCKTTASSVLLSDLMSTWPDLALSLRVNKIVTQQIRSFAVHRSDIKISWCCKSILVYNLFQLANKTAASFLLLMSRAPKAWGLLN